MRIIVLVFAVLCSACGTSSEIKGNWLVACTTDSEASTEYKFDGAQATGESVIYAENSCTTKERASSLTFSYLPGESVDTPVGAKALDIIYVKSTETAFSDSSKTEIENECAGISVTVGTPTDVTGKCGNPVAGTKAYTIYKIDSSVSPRELFMGVSGIDSAHDGSTSDKRHNTIQSSALLSEK